MISTRERNLFVNSLLAAVLTFPLVASIAAFKCLNMTADGSCAAAMDTDKRLLEMNLNKAGRSSRRALTTMSHAALCWQTLNVGSGLIRCTKHNMCNGVTHFSCDCVGSVVN